MSISLLWRAHQRADRDARRLGEGIASVPGIRSLRRLLLRERFLHEAGECWGVYGSFEEARAAAPAKKPLGYDNAAAASMYREAADRVGPNEYAVAYWLQRHLGPAALVFDFGGHVGVKYYALQQVLTLPEGARWVVYDVPAVLESGRRLAAERGGRQIEFTDDFARASGADAFLALGSLQYVETPLHARLAQLERLPASVTISSTPMTDGPAYVTLQNIGTAFCPYLIQNRGELVDGMQRLGYRLVHSWRIPEKRCPILDRPDRSVEGYTSLHFSLPDAVGERRAPEPA